MAQTTAEQRSIGVLAGIWRGGETIAPAPWNPAGGEAETTVEFRPALGGQVLVQEYTQTRRADGAVFAGHGVLRWDAAAGEYVLHWFDSFRTAPSEFRGELHDGELRLGRTQPGIARASWRVSGDTMTHRLEVSADGASWATYIEGTYRRQD